MIGPWNGWRMTDSGEQAGEQADDRAGARRRGRRTGGEDTRAALVEAGRAVFAEQGYAGATVRGIATLAGVDPAMVNHWFGGKQGLFLATIELPFDPIELVEDALDGDRDTVAERIVRNFATMWDTYEGRFATILHSVANQEQAARMVREFFSSAVFGRVTDSLGADQPEWRAALAATQLLGLGITRYVLRLEPLASVDADTLAVTIGPNLQRYLTGPLPGP